MRLKNRFLFLRSLFFYNFKFINLSYSPVINVIELTNRCNYRCVFCPMNTKNDSIKDPVSRKKTSVSVKDFKFLVGKYSHLFHSDGVTLAYHGEPLMHPFFPEIVQILKEKGIKYNLITNGSLLSGKNMKAVLDYCPEHIMFSLYTLDPDKYKKFTETGDLSKTLENMKSFFKHNKGKTRVSIRTINMPMFASEKNDIVKKFSKYPNVDFTFGLLNSWAGRVDISKYDSNIKKHVISTRYKYCIQPWYSVSIGSDLEVFVCNNDDYSIGNLRKDSLKKIWNCAKYKKLRQNILDGKSYRNRLCNGCDCFDPNNVVGKPSSFFLNKSFVRVIKNSLGLNINRDFTLRKEVDRNVKK